MLCETFSYGFPLLHSAMYKCIFWKMRARLVKAERLTETLAVKYFERNNSMGTLPFLQWDRPTDFPRPSPLKSGRISQRQLNTVNRRIPTSEQGHALLLPATAVHPHPEQWGISHPPLRGRTWDRAIAMTPSSLLKRASGSWWLQIM